MLPDNWSKMHWVQKEKFILTVDDPDFLKFILQVEMTAAVQNACKERLKAIGQPAAG
jgi:hypothetical protein